MQNKKFADEEELEEKNNILTGYLGDLQWKADSQKSKKERWNFYSKVWSHKQYFFMRFSIHIHELITMLFRNSAL